MLPKGYTIDTGHTRIDVDLVYRFLKYESYWAADRSFTDVQKSIDHSLNFGLYKKNSMVGFGRIITDFTSFAYLADVFIVKGERGKGLGKSLVEFVLAYPSIKEVRRWMLGTLDAHELYRPYGFNEVSNPKRWMERLHGDGF